MEVYNLYHKHKIEKDSQGNWFYDTKQLGYYSTKEKAVEAIENYRKLSGFCDYPNDFFINEVEIASEKGDNHVTKIYEASHEYELYDNGNIYDIVTMIGVFQDKVTAQNAVEALRTIYPFCEHQGGFTITDYPLDTSYWCEGFDTY